MDRESGAWNRGKGRKKEKEEGGKKGATRAREIEESRGKEGTRRSSDGERREEERKKDTDKDARIYTDIHVGICRDRERGVEKERKKERMESRGEEEIGKGGGTK